MFRLDFAPSLMSRRSGGRGCVTKGDFEAKLVELDRLLNDPDAPMAPARVWALLAEVSCHDIPAPVGPEAPADLAPPRP